MSQPLDDRIKLRRAQANDAEYVREIVRAAYAKWISALGREPTPMMADFNQAIHEHEIDLAISEKNIVGLIEIGLEADHLWIENVAVHPQHQGIGIGRTLLAHAEKRAMQAGLNEIRLQTNQVFATNIALYTALGYEITRYEPFRGGTTVFMTKTLSRVP